MLGILNNGGTCVGVLADSLTKAAVSSKYRSGIREGRLTLISSYDPDAGFNTGNAMGRNKYIYSLADYALVVKSDLEKGGTWNGAVEALSKIKEIPVFVNMIYPIAAGNQELYNRGAKPFPLEFDNGNLQEMLVKTIGDFESVKNEVIIKQPEDNANTISQDLTTIPKDIYNVVLPVILSHLQQPKDAKSLADSLQVRKVQMDDWLTKAINEGKVIKTKIEKRVAYVVNQADTQLSLL
jgi:predicted Rossmann fold nucleotide-binding protein DprA/Smf involved in DNA uptake